MRTYTITTETKWEVLSKILHQTDIFKEIGDGLPLLFYSKTSGEKICPVQVEENKITGIFSTGATTQARTFVDSILKHGSFPELEPGLYLFDFEKQEILINVDNPDILGKDGWVSFPPDYDKCNFDYLIALDNNGLLHRIYHRFNSFAETAYLGHLINETFGPGDYKLDKVGVQAMFEAFGDLYGLRKPNIRNVVSFLENSFRPLGAELPSYTVSTTMLEMVFEPEVIDSEAKEIIPFCGYEDGLPPIGLEGLGGGFWDEDYWDNIVNRKPDGKIRSMDLIGVTKYPEVKKVTYIDIDVTLDGLISMHLNPPGTLFIKYDSRKISYRDIKDALDLPDDHTFYEPIVHELGD